MIAERVKNEIHCRVAPEVMRFIQEEAERENKSISDVCRELLASGIRAREESEIENRLIAKSNKKVKRLKEEAQTLKDIKYPSPQFDQSDNKEIVSLLDVDEDEEIIIDW